MTKEREDAKLSEFRDRVSDIQKPDLWDDDRDRFLRRWLIARNWNVDKAETMLRKSMEYRARTRSDQLLSTYKAPEVLEKYYVGGVCGFDKEGFPIWLDPFTLLDSRGILHSVSKDQVLLHKLYSCELLLEILKYRSKKLEKAVDQIVVIFDMNGLSWHHLWPPGIDCMKAIVSVFEDNYPELLKKTYVINAPRLFVLAYNMFKSVMSPRTTDKVHVLGGHWKEALLVDIDADQLPVEYGGTQVDEDGNPRCPSKVLYGGEVPKSYYITNNDISVDMQAVHIANCSSKHIEYEISVDRCQLRYKIKSERHDIAFGFLYKPLGSDICKYSNMEVVQKVVRVNTHMALQGGVLDCHRPGVYVLVLDNSFSWTKGKVVRYSVEIVPCEGDSDSFSSALNITTNDDDAAEPL